MTAMTAIASRKEKGFTLIELVMVIVILGILAAFALPRFADLSGDARQASIEGARGAVKAASAIAHSAWLARGSSGSVDLDGTVIDMSTNGYPVAITPTGVNGGITEAAQLDTSDYALSNTPVTTATTLKVTLGSCSFSYDEVDGSVDAVSGTC